MKALYKDDIEIGIYDVRKDTDVAKYSEEYKSRAYLGSCETLLPEITWRDTPDCRSDGSLPGCNNCIWLISDDEVSRYITLNTERANMKAAIKVEKEKVINDKISALKEKARSTGEKQLLRTYTSYECLDNLSDCSFDNVSIWIMPDGSEKQTHTHCY